MSTLSKRVWLVLFFSVFCSVPAMAQDEGAAPERGSTISLNAGIQGGLGISGQFAAGGRFFLLSERQSYGLGLGVSFLITDRNVFIPSLNATANVSGTTLFTEMIARVVVLDMLQVQAAFGMAVVKREGRVKGFPVEVNNQGPYVGADTRFLIGPNLALYTGARMAFLEQGTITISGKREFIPLPIQPAIFMGVAWEF